MGYVDRGSAGIGRENGEAKMTEFIYLYFTSAEDFWNTNIRIVLLVLVVMAVRAAWRKMVEDGL